MFPGRTLSTKERAFPTGGGMTAKDIRGNGWTADNWCTMTDRGQDNYGGRYGSGWEDQL